MSETRETVPKGTKLGDLVRRLADRLEPGFGQLALDKNRQVHPGVMIVVADRVIPPARLSDWRLKERVVLEICALVAGG